ncbi:MAG: hypothetical protein K9I94_13285, partial [Bacteroidales bacterium]|nr:hypothetical protein [Bacteroidales bacterium]
YISWSVYPSSPEGITILDNEKLFDLTFNFRGVESSIAFDQTNCEVSDNNLETIDVTYFDGLMEGNSVLDVKVFLEGPYNSSDGEMNTGLNTNGAIPLNQPYNTSPWNYTGNETLDEIPDDMIDWVLIELRETSGNIYSATPDKTIAQYAAVLNKDGSVVSTTGNKISILELITENLYVIVRHRNHLDIMSSQPLDKVNGVYEYNFTTGTSKVFKGVQKNLGSFKYGMYAGDGTLDGNINFGDFVLYMMNQGATGYNYPDYNLDYTVNDPDRTMMIQNNGANQRIVE